jgi:hypothetical protein
MTRQSPSAAPAGGLEHPTPQPSTRRVASGSPVSPDSSPGEPVFSAPPDPADAVFAALKERIRRLWDEGATAEDLKSMLGAGQDGPDPPR